MCATGWGWGENTSVYHMIMQNPLKYALCVPADFTIPASPHTLASPAFFQPSNLPSSFPANGPCPSHSFCLERSLPGSLLNWPFSVKLLLTCHFHREGFPHCPLPTLTSHIHHNLISEISFLLNYSCVNFLRFVYSHFCLHASLYNRAESPHWAPQ